MYITDVCLHSSAQVCAEALGALSNLIQVSQQAALGQWAVSNLLLQSGKSLQSGETHRMEEALVPAVLEHQTLGQAVAPGASAGRGA